MKRSNWRDWPVRATRTFAPDHPALEGHFPVYPVLPGVLVLDWVCRELAGAASLSVREARFAHPCDPGSRLALRVQAHAGLSRFAVTAGQGSGETVVVSGMLEPPSA
ncbi:MAG: hypothetical protein LBE78_04855 [Burkholderiaceae bacterium]|jgi:3-hydroxymyristoyl/3-hydroxydecanoyl-(acyl carrier protein) dehydratase|nr:hypothetical protein [Burkholderiaceae bacterium]